MADHTIDDMAVEKQQRAQRLVLGRCAHVALDGQVRQESVDLGLGHVCWMA
jgi:hypothetical protein